MEVQHERDTKVHVSWRRKQLQRRNVVPRTVIIGRRVRPTSLKVTYIKFGEDCHQAVYFNSRCFKQSMPPKPTTSPSKMDTDDSSTLSRPRPQKSGSVKKTARMPTPSAPPNATAIGAEPQTTPTQQPDSAMPGGIDAEHTTTHAKLPASSNHMALPFPGGPVAVNTAIQSNQANSDILHSDAYLSARNLLVATQEPDARQCSPAANATVTHSHFSELLTRAMSDISAGGHDNLLPAVILPGLAHLVDLIKETCSTPTPTKATHSATESTTTSLDTTTFAFRSHPAKSSAFSAPVSAATPKSTDAVQEITAPAANPKTFTLAFRSQSINSSAFSTPVSSSTAQPFPFLSLPLDVQIRTLSFVPETNVALNCRLVCREFCNLVDGNETHIAQLVAERELSRLRYQINLRKQMMSSNLTDFVLDAALWVQLRGFCPEKTNITIDSFTSWRYSPNRHYAMLEKGIQARPHDLPVWDILTENLLRLQLDLHRDVGATGEKQVATLQGYVVPPSADCSQATLLEYQRLCFMIWEQPVSEPFFNGQEHDHAYGEMGTFPELRLSTASYGYLGLKSLQPAFPAHKVQELGLPEVRDPKFFYYFENGVGRDVFERLTPLTPLKRASLLKMVKLF